ncbi:MAG: NUDIX hydrolase [Candidatus Doudnabacteria bacterium]|nr:NUDIX hydrolase [Candidatus Doudnabacteria bacterium]
MDRQAYLDSLAKKRMGAGALFFNVRGEILLVKPSYKEGWILPGGSVEDHESPKTACRREVEEEIGLIISSFRLICVDYCSSKEGEAVQFLFDGGTLTEEDIAKIVIQESELLGFKFVKENELEAHLNTNLKSRVKKSINAIRKNISIYLENGEYV